VWRETRLLREEDIAHLETVRLAPVIFQEYVPAEVDLRITVVGDRLFPAAIYSQSTDYPVDFRMSLGQAAVSTAVLPQEIDMKLRELINRLGLLYGAIDMRRTPSGEHVFLEVNTAGEFLFIEERTGQEITKALADLLAS
jgi:glutathione synthase/RimK-type ligase-like ATP-grasp enzyme